MWISKGMKANFKTPYIFIISSLGEISFYNSFNRRISYRGCKNKIS